MSFNQKNYINEYKKQNYSTFKVDLKKEEKEELNSLLKKRNLTNAAFLRNAIKNLKKECRKMKNEYMVTCVTFENNEIDGADFKNPLYGHDYYMDYKPKLSEIKSAYGKGWEDVKEIYITTMPENAETSDDYIEEKIINKDF